MQITLTLTESQHRHLRELLYPGDGLESVALMLCGRRAGANRHKLVVRQIIPLPDSAYIDRAPDRVSWKTDILITLLNEAAKSQLAVVKVHSHPGGYTAFSAFDDMSDQALFPSVHGWIDDGQPHGSVILLPDGKLFGRAFELNGNIVPFDSIMVVGDDILIWNAEDISSKSVPAHAKRNVQVFGSATYDKLCRMHIAVVGCSGTGSIVIEQLARYGVGHLVIIDPKTLEDKNLNRILNSTAVDVGRPKVDVLAERIHAMGMGTTVERYACNLFNVDALKAVAGCDVVLGCMDSIDGRDLLNKIATFYLLPYIDIGVRLEADGQGGIDQICGTIHYLQPGRSSLLTRGLYTAEQLRGANLKRHAPEVYADEEEEGYIAGALEDRPAVITINMYFSSLGVLELLARIHPYRFDPNSKYASLTVSLAGMFSVERSEGEPDERLARFVGRGDMEPLLNTPLLST